MNSDDDPEKEAQDLRLFLAKRVDGAFSSRNHAADCRRTFTPSSRPRAFLSYEVDAPSAPRLRSDVVTVDEEGGAC